MNKLKPNKYCNVYEYEPFKNNMGIMGTFTA